MHNVMYHFTGTIAVHIRRLYGQLLPKGEFPVFDDKNSFTLQIEAAEIAISSESLANTLNSYVFSDPDAPLRAISVRIESLGRFKVRGKLHSKGDLPFEITGDLSATPEGKIRLHARSIKALHLPLKGILDLLGLHIADLIKTGKVAGVQMEKNDLILDPNKLLPPPHIAGQVTNVKLENDSVVLAFGVSDRKMSTGFSTGNYMAFRGNRLRFGKLTMSDTDMVLVDMDPRDPFDFYLDHYKDQLVAGYTKETPSFGLRVFMRDYDKLVHPKRTDVADRNAKRESGE